MGQIFVDTPNEGRILVNIAGEEPTSEEEKMIKVLLLFFFLCF